MNALRRWRKLALALVALVAVAQIGASLLVRTHRVHDFLVAKLSRAFGRPVDVQHFGAQLLPSPTLDAAGISVGEDPAFGNEYFLRAESFSAGLRWTGLLRGQFEFGTLSFSRPSLILVRNPEGRWNLERWLPPAKSANDAVSYGPQQATPANHLRTIEFDDGRVNFKTENDKQAFAFINVAGRVEQVDSGRWQLQLQATPWRSGVALQSTGTLRVRGDVAGTSARLQPAQIQVHWDEASLADLFRLWRGQDHGVRGLFALDATLQSGLPDSQGKPQPSPGAWTFSVQARAQRLHRWDLPERGDNPRLNAALQGRFFSDGRPMQPARFAIEAPNSNLHGEFSLGPALPGDLSIRLDSMGVRAEDLLAWYRAFQPNVDEGITVRQFFTGSATIRGWPPRLESAGFSSPGGTVKIPGIDGLMQVGAMRGGRDRSRLTIEPVRISWNSAPAAEDKGSAAAKRKNPADARSVLNIGLTHDFAAGDGGLAIDGRTARSEQVLRMAQAFGRTANHGWEATGEASAAMQWNWSLGRPARWNGKLAAGHAKLQVAGLNQPLLLEDAVLTYKEGRRTAEITRAQGFGANWRGQIAEAAPDSLTSSELDARWQFALQADKLDAADLDRWVGPRARPGWLQRLMDSLLGASNPGANANASELLRRVSAEGELRIEDLTIEKLHLSKFRAQGGLRELRLDVREAEAQWAGGSVRGAVKAQFAPKAGYEISVELDRVNLAQLPAPLAARLSGVAFGKLRVTASGVGRDELLQSLEGRAEVRLKNVELRGWDVSASMADGAAHVGVTRWPEGKGLLLLRDRSVVLNDFRLEDGTQLTLLNGRITFGQDADLSIENGGAGKRPSNPASAGRVLKISGPLDGPRVSVENAVARQPAD